MHQRESHIQRPTFRPIHAHHMSYPDVSYIHTQSKRADEKTGKTSSLVDGRGRC